MKKENLREVKGKLIKKLNVESGKSSKGKDWKSQTCIIDTGSEFNNLIAVKSFGEEHINSMNILEVGDDVLIHVNVYSNEHNGRYYNNIQGWFFTKQGQIDPTSFVTSDIDPF